MIKKRSPRLFVYNCLYVLQTEKNFFQIARNLFPWGTRWARTDYYGGALTGP